MKKNKFKTTSNSKSKIDNNKNTSNKNTKSSKVSFKNTKLKLEDKSNNKSKNNSFKKSKTKIYNKNSKENIIFKEKKIEKIDNKSEKKNEIKIKDEEKEKENEEEKENEKKNHNNLSLTKKDFNILITNFNFKRNPSSKLKQNKSLNNPDFNEKLILKHLTNKRNDLHNEISKINGQNSYLKEASLNNLQMPNNLMKHSQIRLIKNLNQSKENLLDKVSSINQQIYQIKTNQKNNSNISDFSKEEYSENIRKEFIFNNMNKWNRPKSNIKKKIKDLDKKNNSNLLRKQNENSKEKESKNNGKFISEEKHKEFINNVISKNKNNNYLYQKMASSFDEKEKIYITECIKPKNIEIKKINKLDIKYNSLKKRIDNLANLDKLHKMWKERSELLPKYVSPLYQKIINTEENEKKEEKEKIEKKKLLYELKLNYGKEKVSLPKISLLLKKEWEKKELKFNFDKSKEFKNLINKNINIKVIQLRNKNKIIYNNDIKKSNSVSEINQNIKLNNLLLRNHKNIKDSNSFKITNNKLNLNNNDSFLKSSQDINNIEEIKKNKFSTIKIQNNKEKNLDNIKYKVEMMEDKYKRGKELLKLKGGYLKNEDFGDEMNDLLINSIKGKLDMIEMIKS